MTIRYEVDSTIQFPINTILQPMIFTATTRKRESQKLNCSKKTHLIQRDRKKFHVEISKRKYVSVFEKKVDLIYDAYVTGALSCIRSDIQACSRTDKFPRVSFSFSSLNMCSLSDQGLIKSDINLKA